MASGRGSIVVRFHGKNLSQTTEYQGSSMIQRQGQHCWLPSALQDMGIAVSFPSNTNLCILTDHSGKEICRGSR